MDALALLGQYAVDAVPAIAENLNSPRWQLRVGACEALRRIDSADAVEPLVARMQIEGSGRVGNEIYDSLKSITHIDLHRNPEGWWDWWEAERANKAKQLPPPPKVFAISSIEIFTSRVGFVLDTSASMEQVFEPDAASARSLALSYSGATKLAIGKGEIAQAIASLDPRSHFTLIALGTPVRSFAKAPVPLSPANVASVAEWLRTFAGVGGTDLVGGLRAALELNEGPDDSPDFRDTPDTITVLTDGTSSDGAMPGDAVVEWYAAQDRYARIRTNVIVLGTARDDLGALRSIAETSGGTFTCLKER